MKTVLTIAGSDCSGGAGIQADIKTMIMNGVYAMSVITALTAQNTTGVFGIQESPVEFVDQQMDCVFQDIFPDAVKIGMLSSPEIMHHVAAGLQKYEARHIARAISNEFHISVLLKGGHRVEDANDLLYTDGKTQWLKGERIDNPNTHGTGCTLSSAIASNLAKGYDLTDSVIRAKSYLTDALRADLNLGKGSGPLDHSLGDYAKKFFY